MIKQKYKFKHALVTGGAGFIGSHLAAALVESGSRVSVVDNFSTGSSRNLQQIQNDISIHQGDIRDLDFLLGVSKNCDVIFHFAAEVSVPKTVENPAETATINEIGTINTLEAARKNNIARVVLASSCSVYGDDPALPKSESLTPKPESPYAVQKLAGELYARLYNNLFGIQTVCLRYFNVYGPRQDSSSPYSGVISLFITRGLAEKVPDIYGDGSQFRDFVFVKDAVKATMMAAIADRAAGQVINVGTGKQTSIKDLWHKIRRLTGTELEPLYHPPRSGDILKSVADTALAKKNIGFEPDFSLENGLEMTARWYKKPMK
jgi:UDP-N-acetylglucosamine/UDP-N-acetyl-alpha-D-glucosaminouronate 4-epimerase